ncbi:hypothetical protein WAI88_20405, partial [Acinetobacter baumannii]
MSTLANASPMTIHQTNSLWEKILRALSFGARSSDPSLGRDMVAGERPSANEVRLDECMDGVDRDESASSFFDVTEETLADMRQE